MQLNKIPATVVTGFLGSGKTTLLANVLRQASGKRIAVIVNEFGELDIDADLLRSCPLDCEEEAAVVSGENGIYELSNGCICCTVEEEFLPVMQQLVERRDDIDHVLIETSGLALPKPLVQAFNWPDIKQHFTVDAVVAVVDGPAVAAGRFADDVEKVNQQRLDDESLDHERELRELLEDQLDSADLVVVSKTDALEEDQRQRVEATLDSRVSDSVKRVYVSHGEASIDWLIGVDARAEERIEALQTHHDHHHSEGEHHEHAHEHFDNHVITVGEVDAGKLQAQIKALVSAHDIFRVKGFAAIPGKPMRQVLQVVGERLDHYYDRPWDADEPRQTRLVFIGRNLDAGQLSSALQRATV